MRDSDLASVGMRPIARCRLLGFVDCGDADRVGVHTQAGQGVDTVNVHRAATTNTLTASSAESQSRVDSFLIRIRASSIMGPVLFRSRCRTASGASRGLVGVPAVDLEGLHLGILGWE